MEEFIKKMRNLAIDNETVGAIGRIVYINFDGRTKQGTEAIVAMGADLGTLNPNE